MGWTVVFAIASGLATVLWAALILLPRWPALLAAILYLGSGLLCLFYVVGLVGLLTGAFAPAGAALAFDFTSIEGVRATFASDGAITVAMIHYLAFDLFIGLWIARDADAKGFSRVVQAPILIATFLVGPAGLFVWLLMRERRARANGRWQ